MPDMQAGLVKWAGRKPTWQVVTEASLPNPCWSSPLSSCLCKTLLFDKGLVGTFLKFYWRLLKNHPGFLCICETPAVRLQCNARVCLTEHWHSNNFGEWCNERNYSSCKPASALTLESIILSAVTHQILFVSRYVEAKGRDTSFNSTVERSDTQESQNHRK